MATLYTIKGWDSLYENAGSRKILGSLDWFPLPTKHDGLSYGRLMRRSDGMEMYAAWVLILAVAAKCPTRGTLANGEGPLSADDIATKTRTSENVIKRALQLFSSKDIPWLATSTLPDSPDDLALQDRTGQDITEPDRTVQDSCGEASQATASPPAPPEPVELSGYVFPTRGKHRSYPLPAAKLAEYRESYPGLDVHRELAKALQWCRDNESRRKTAKGMPAFLGRWLSGACDRTTGPPATASPSRARSDRIDPIAFRD
jgi:hypothetical protein